MEHSIRNGNSFLLALGALRPLPLCAWAMRKDSARDQGAKRHPDAWEGIDLPGLVVKC